MKRKELYTGMHVALGDDGEAYILETGGWELIKYLRNDKLPDFKVPVVMFKNPYPQEEHESTWSFDSYFVQGDGLPCVALAVLRKIPAHVQDDVSYPEQMMWIPKIVKCNQISCTWKNYLQTLEFRRIAKERQLAEKEKEEAYKRSVREIREDVERRVRDLKLDVEFDPVVDYERGCMDWPITDETKAVIDLYDLKRLLDNLPSQDASPDIKSKVDLLCALCGDGDDDELGCEDCRKSKKE